MNYDHLILKRCKSINKKTQVLLVLLRFHWNNIKNRIHHHLDFLIQVFQQILNNIIASKSYMATLLCYLLNNDESPPRQLTTLEKLRIALVLVPGITLVAVILAAGGISYVCRKIITTGLTRTYYLIRSAFVKFGEKTLPQNLKEKIMSKQQIDQFNSSVRKQIQENQKKIYVVVRNHSSKQQIPDSLLMELDNVENVLTVIKVCRKVWELSQMQSIQLFSQNRLVEQTALVKDLKKDYFGVVELSLCKMQTFG